MTSPVGSSFWESDEAVERFTDRQPDVRLLEVLEGYADPERVRVLDIGCAAGRNTVILAERGFDVFAIDSSAAMVARTRERVGRILGHAEAERRVLLGRMDDLRAFGDASVDVAVALGVLHQAASAAAVDRSDRRDQPHSGRGRPPARGVVESSLEATRRSGATGGR